MDWKSFLMRLVDFAIKEKARLRSNTMAAICARILALHPLITLGFSRILRSSFKVLFARSEADLIFLIS